MSNKLNNESIYDIKIEELHMKINSSVIGILAILYETGIVKRVSIKKVMDLYGADTSFDEFSNEYIEFDSPEFLHDYDHYKKIQYSKEMIKKQRKYIDNKFNDIYEHNPKITLH